MAKFFGTQVNSRETQFCVLEGKVGSTRREIRQVSAEIELCAIMVCKIRTLLDKLNSLSRAVVSA